MIKLNLPTTILLLFYVLMIFNSCSKKNYSYKPEYHFKCENGKPDYSDLHCWAAHPYKYDPSDSIPTPLRKYYLKDSIADVFFIYPTSFTDIKDTNWNAKIDDPELNAKTDYGSILYQASCFNEQTRVFAPRYRQANIRAFFSDDKLSALKAFDLAYQDVKKAFLFYMDHYNNGRPIIIASHSQGTVHAGRLLKEFFDGKPLQQKLICAYVIGMPTPVDYFKNIPSCKDSTSTGCFVGWRTFKKGYTDTSYISKEKFKSAVTNPLNWNSNLDYAADTKNTGGVLKNFNKIKNRVVDAQIHENILWTERPHFFGSFLIKKKNYHIGDINLFYTNIRENVKTRIRMYYKK
jgi:hypothetical protein